LELIIYRFFFRYLESWIYKGQCCDSHQEFLIRVNGEQLVRRDRHYWTDGFALDPISRLSDDCLPFVNSCLEDDAILGLVSDIYLCGKTVHLLQLCQTKVKPFLHHFTLFYFATTFFQHL